ncbi:hypothetical protein Hanom_Chr15g01405811 [Helianthus anomalus]
MREFGIGHTVETILDAPENTVVVADVNERALGWVQGWLYSVP